MNRMIATDYDMIIVGAGMAGLYTAYKILKKSPETRLLIVEREGKTGLGGRAGNIAFSGTSVVTGAGIGRFEKDVLLRALMEDLGLPINTFEAGMDYSPAISEPCNVRSIFLALKREYNSQCRELGRKIHMTFKAFATQVLGKKEYIHFITCAGYTDYEKEDVYDTLYHYGFDDNYKSWTGFSVPWSQLVEKMSEKIGLKNIQFDSDVYKVVLEPGCYSVLVKRGTRHCHYYTEKVVLATTIDTVQALVPVNKPLYKQVKGQPFLRLYGKFSKSSIPILKEHIQGHLTAVPGPLQKIVPINMDKGIYMISYSDNDRATTLKPYLKNTVSNRELICQLVEEATNIPTGSLVLLDMMDVFWEIGTHYYEPLTTQFKRRQEFIMTIQHPMPGFMVVGEAVALNQGWVEGALESVNKILV
jgi:Flavin containing amine oxidoreductase